MITVLIIAIGVAIATYLYMRQPVFGENPAGARLERISKSTHYKDGIFQNLKETPVMAPDVSYPKMMWQLLNKPSNTDPSHALPSTKTDLKSLPDSSLVWFGHSSYLIKIDGKFFLVDPVFSGNASPVSFFGKSYPGTDVYSPDDFPPLDGIIISHDHYDHLDYSTIVEFKDETFLYTPRCRSTPFALGN